jgi:hypothetical protein
LLFIKSGISPETSSLHRSVSKVANSEGPEEILSAVDSPIRDYQLGRTFKKKTAAISLLPHKYVYLENAAV